MSLLVSALENPGESTSIVRIFWAQVSPFLFGKERL